MIIVEKMCFSKFKKKKCCTPGSTLGKWVVNTYLLFSMYDNTQQSIEHELHVAFSSGYALVTMTTSCLFFLDALRNVPNHHIECQNSYMSTVIWHHSFI